MREEGRERNRIVNSKYVLIYIKKCYTVNYTRPNTGVTQGERAERDIHV